VRVSSVDETALRALRGTDEFLDTTGITHEGSTWLRWILIQAVPKTVRGSARLRSLYQRVARRRGTQKAKVAVARELLVIIWHMLRSGQPYQERTSKHR